MQPRRTARTRAHALPSRCAVQAIALAATFAAGGGALGQSSHSWTFAGDGTWSVASNWLGGVPDGNDNVFLSAGGSGPTVYAISLTTAYAGWRITSQAGAGSYTINGGGTISLFDFGNTAGTGPKIENLSSNLLTFANAIVLDSDVDSGQAAEINPINGDILFTNTVDLADAGNTQLRIFGSNSRTITFDGVISGGNSVSLNQSSIASYGAANTYTGDTFVNAGTLQFKAGGAANSSIVRLGDTTGTAAAALDLSQAGASPASTLVVRPGSSGVKTLASSNGSGSVTWGGAIFLDADLATSTVAGGTLNLTGSAGGTIDLKNQTLTVSGAGTTVISGVLQNSTGLGKLVKTGTGVLVLSGANTATGNGTISNGTVLLSGGDNRIRTGSTVNLFNVAASGSAALDLGGNSQSLGTLFVPSPVNNGVTHTVTNGTLTLTGNSTLRGANNGLFDMSGLTALTFNASSSTFQIDSWNVDTFTHASDTNFPRIGAAGGITTITAGTFQVGGGNSAGLTGNVARAHLGTQSRVNASTFRIGGFNANGLIDLQSGLTNPWLVLRGTAGGATAMPALIVGETSSGTRAGDGTLNMAGGTIDVIATGFSVGRHIANANSTVTGTVGIPGGALDVGTLIVGEKTGTGNATVTASYTQSGGTLKVGTILFGNNLGTGTSTFNNTLTLDGVTLSAGTIAAAQPGGANIASSRNLNWTSGTIRNYDSSTNLRIAGRANSTNGTLGLNLNTSANHTILIDAGRVGVIESTARVAFNGPLVKDGGGLLVLNGTLNTGAGKTSVIGGTLKLVGGDTALGTAPGSAVADQLSLNGTTLSFSRGYNGLLTLTTAPTNYTSFPSVDLPGVTGEVIYVTGGVGRINVSTGGVGYTSAPTVGISAPDMPGGVQAVATATVSGGAVTGFTVTTAGSGYSTVPTIVLTGGGATTQGTASVGTVSLLGLSLVNAGYDYLLTGTGPANLAFSGGGGTGAAGTAAHTATGDISLAANRGLFIGASGGTLETVGGSHTIAGVVSGPGSILKIGEGSVGLTGVNTYQGTTRVSAVSGTDSTLRITSNASLGDPTLGQTLTLDGRDVTGIFSGSRGARLIIDPGAGNTVALDTNAGGGANAREISLGIANLAANGPALSTIEVGSGTLIVSGNVRSDAGATAAGKYNVLKKFGGGTLSLGGADNLITGALEVRGGTVLVGPTSVLNINAITERTKVGSNTGLNGTLVFQGTGAITARGGFFIGDQTNNLTESAVVVENSGSLLVNGTGAASNFYMANAASGNSGRALLTVRTGGTLKMNYDSGAGFVVGQGGGSSVGTVTVASGGLLDVLLAGTTPGRIQLGGATGAAGWLQLTGTSGSVGTLLTSAEIQNAGGAGTILFDGGALKSRDRNNTVWINSNLNTLIRAGGATLDTNGFDMTVPAVLQEDAGSPGGGLAKSGAGVLTLSGINTYTGTTVVNAGTLRVTGTHTGGGAYTIGDGVNPAVLAGTGTISAGVTVRPGATLSPGGSIGTLTVGAISLEGGSVYVMDVNAANGTENADKTVVTTGGVTLGDGVSSFPTLQFVFSPAFIGTFGTPPAGKTFIVVQKDSAGAVAAGSRFAGAPDDTLVIDGLVKYTVDYDYSGAAFNGSGDGNDVAVTFHEVPEPGSAALLAAAVALAARRRRAR